jgi:mono/diheme cytochrome c family protein
MQKNRMTKAAAIKWIIITSAISGFSACASAQDIAEGKTQYQSSCAPCHGTDAKGDGPVSTELKTRPADLTVLAKNNDGVFPYDMVYQVIDGRNSTIPSHGTREMPVWGYRFGPPEAFRFKHHILAVIDYLESLQVSRPEASQGLRWSRNLIRRPI